MSKNVFTSMVASVFFFVGVVIADSLYDYLNESSHEYVRVRR